MLHRYFENTGCKVIRNIILMLTLTLIVGMFSTMNVSALTQYDIVVEEYDEYTSAQRWENINLKSSDVLESHAPHIYNMDVSVYGKVAVSLKSPAQQSVAVFDENGAFLKSFTFDSYGSIYVVWNYENLVLLSVRGDTAYEFTLDGEPVAVYSYDTDGTLYRTLEQKRIENNGNVYEIKKDSVLTKTDSTGHETILYKSLVSIPNWLFVVVVPLVVFPTVLYIILKPMIKPNGERKSTQQKEQN